MAAWAIRNSLVGGELTNRALGWHPVSGDNIRTGVRTFSTLIVPVDAMAKRFTQSGWFG